MDNTITNQLRSFLSEHFVVMSIFSIISFFLSIAVVIVFIIILPKNYFCTEFVSKKNPLRPMGLFRNFAALILFIIGFILLFLPGQGMIFILIGFAVSELPLRRQIICRLLKIESIQKSLDLIRKKANKPPFNYPK